MLYLVWCSDPEESYCLQEMSKGQIDTSGSLMRFSRVTSRLCLAPEFREGMKEIHKSTENRQILLKPAKQTWQVSPIQVCINN